MQTKFKLSVIATLLGILTAATALAVTPLEKKYLETRDGYIRQYKETKQWSDDSAALAELEKQIKAILGPVTIEGFSKPGKINLETLQNSMGFGQIDGLRFYSGRDLLVVTTKNLLNNYLTERPELPKDFRQLSKTGLFYRRAMFDADITYSVELPIRSPKSGAFARAFLGATYQVLMPKIPTDIYIFVYEDERIFLVKSDAEVKISDIPSCRLEWDKYSNKSADAYEAYQRSEHKDKKASADSQRYMEQGIEAYHNCFGREASNQTYFGSLTSQAQSIVNRLH